MIGRSERKDEHGGGTAHHSAAPSLARSRWFRLSMVLAVVCFPGPAFAALITMTFESVAGAVPITGAGTGRATLNLGRVSAFEPLTGGVRRSIGASSYTISTSVGVRATHKVALVSSSYTLQARLRSSSPLTWQIDGINMSTSVATISTSQPYAATIPHTIGFVVPFSAVAGPVTTILEVTAIAN